MKWLSMREYVNVVSECRPNTRRGRTCTLAREAMLAKIDGARGEGKEAGECAIAREGGGGGEEEDGDGGGGASLSSRGGGGDRG